MKNLKLIHTMCIYFFALALVSVSVGCGSAKSSAPADEADESTKNLDDDDDTDDDTDDDIDAKKLAGTWGNYECTFEKSLGADTFSFFTVSGSSLVRTVRTYYTKQQYYRCSKTAVVLRMHYKYKTAKSSLGDNIVKFNMHLKRVEMVAADAHIAATLNKIKYFGFSNWVAKKVKIVKPPFDPKYFPQVPYDIALVEGDLLYWGDSSRAARNGTTPAKRPNKIDYNSLVYRLN